MSGYIHVYTGDGKGKTSAAIGLAVRAKGAGLNVSFYGFLKGRDSAERTPLANLGIAMHYPPQSPLFVFEMSDTQQAEAAAITVSTFQAAVRTAAEFDLLILDEVFAAISVGFLPEEALLTFLKEKPDSLEVVLTGRNAGTAICALAQYVSEITAVKHPYPDGRPARYGIEY